MASGGRPWEATVGFLFSFALRFLLVKPTGNLGVGARRETPSLITGVWPGHELLYLMHPRNQGQPPPCPTAFLVFPWETLFPTLTFLGGFPIP